MPLAASGTMNHHIAAELYTALEALDAPPHLLGILGAWGDGLTDEEALEMLKGWNEERVAAPA